MEGMSTADTEGVVGLSVLSLLHSAAWIAVSRCGLLSWVYEYEKRICGWFCSRCLHGVGVIPGATL